MCPLRGWADLAGTATMAFMAGTLRVFFVSPSKKAGKAARVMCVKTTPVGKA
jgi:hypothetical protein